MKNNQLNELAQIKNPFYLLRLNKGKKVGNYWVPVSQSDMAKRLNTSQPTISKIEQETLKPNLEIICALKNNFGNRWLNKVLEYYS